MPKILISLESLESLESLNLWMLGVVDAADRREFMVCVKVVSRGGREGLFFIIFVNAIQSVGDALRQEGGGGSWGVLVGGGVVFWGRRLICKRRELWSWWGKERISLVSSIDVRRVVEYKSWGDV